MATEQETQATQIAEEAVKAVLADYDLKPFDQNESPWVTLGFEMGNGIEYETALLELAKRAALIALERRS